MSWDTVESDPAVFSDLLDAMGVRGLELTELYDLSTDSLRALSPVGLLFLFKYSRSANAGVVEDGSAPDAPWFANQTVNNACGTQALLHIVLNADPAVHAFQLGDTLTAFKEFTAGLPPRDRGNCLEACDAVRIAHNSFARPEPFINDERRATKSDDVFHFAAFVPSRAGDCAFELDGLQRGPVRLPPSSDGVLGWIASAGDALRKRIDGYAGGELRFTLLAVVRDARVVARDAVRAARDELEEICATLMSLEGDADADDTVRDIRSRQAALLADVAAAESAEVTANERRADWTAENARRRHNFVPLLLALLCGLAGAKRLAGLIEAGRADEMAARARRKAEKDAQ
jgi:ubiquitin carboxyl-terminal hydrolase L5